MKNNTSLNLMLKSSSIAFTCIVLIYFLDPIIYILSSDFDYPSIPVGLFASLLGIILFIFFYNKQKIKLIDLILFISFLGFFISVIISKYSEPLDYWIVLRMISYTSIGYFLPKAMFPNKIALNKKLKSLSILLVLSSGFVGWFFLNNPIGTTNAVYLRPGHAITIACIFCFYYLKDVSRLGSIIFIIFIVIMLIFINSRSTIVGLLLSLLITEFFFRRSTGKALYTLIIPLSVVIVLNYLNNLYEQGYDGIGYRLVRLISATNEDTSLEQRTLLYEYGKEYFYKGFYSFGNYKYYAPLGEGNYIHDLRSYIAEFGIFGLTFLLVEFYVFIKFIVSFKNMYLSDYRISIIFALVIYAIFNLLFAQHFTYSSTFLIFGMALYIIKNQQFIKTVLANT